MVSDILPIIFHFGLHSIRYHCFGTVKLAEQRTSHTGGCSYYPRRCLQSREQFNASDRSICELAPLGLETESEVVEERGYRGAKVRWGMREGCEVVRMIKSLWKEGAREHVEVNCQYTAV